MNDYISREAVIKELEEEIEAGNIALDEDVWTNRGLKIALKDVKAAKAADVQPIRHGRWIDIHEYCKMNGYIPSGVAVYYWCSECMKEQEKTSDFCPNCGARMDGDAE